MQLTLHSPVEAFLQQEPDYRTLFTALGLDLAADGPLPLAVACASHGLNPVEVLAALVRFAAAAGNPSELDAEALDPAALIEQIVATHHSFLRRELPQLVVLADKLAAWEGLRKPDWHRIADTLRVLERELIPHLCNEELVLFPEILRRVRLMGNGVIPPGSLTLPLQQSEHEHLVVTDNLRRLRALTQNYTGPGRGSPEAKVLLTGLRQLELDLHLHFHKENALLHPMARLLDCSIR